MGLSTVEIGFLGRLLARKIISPGWRLLEIGESETVGTPAALLAQLRREITTPRFTSAAAEIDLALSSVSEYQLTYGSARAIYRAVFDPVTYLAADLDLGARRLCVDLNRPFKYDAVFDCCINNGTSEHLFNQENIFRIVHDHTRPGGLMLHWTPGLGWLNHGMYNVQPQFFFDLARANKYEVRYIELGGADFHYELRSGNDAHRALAEFPELSNSMICAALTKTSNRDFRTPIQGIFAKGVRPGQKVAKQIDRSGYPAFAQPNLALNQAATQSSTSPWSWHDDPDQDARGGNNGIITGYYGFHTALEDNPWWMVELDETQPIAHVVVYNCLDLKERAASISVETSVDKIEWEAVPSPIGDFGGADGRPLLVQLDAPRPARFVRVMLKERNYLHLDEIQVYGPGPGLPRTPARDSARPAGGARRQRETRS